LFGGFAHGLALGSSPDLQEMRLMRLLASGLHVELARPTSASSSRCLLYVPAAPLLLLLLLLRGGRGEAIE